MTGQLSEKNNLTPPPLFPPISPYRQQMLDVGDNHTIYVEECGHPEGFPVAVIHGGPGGGCSPNMRRYFDPSKFRIVLFDQRGCGRSRPYASVNNNTTWDLVSDIEKIRQNLLINKMTLFGGSWGATLSLLYAQTYPQNVSSLILRGVFTMTQSELDWFYVEGGASRFWPDAWRIFKGMIPEDEHIDLIKAYNKRLFGASPSDQEKFSRAWTGWENALASLKSLGFGFVASTEYAKAFARIENHYFLNKGFLDSNSQIERDLYKISGIPATIVQGRYDMITPPWIADKLHRQLPKSKLLLIPEAGHAMSEPGITEALIMATEETKNNL